MPLTRYCLKRGAMRQAPALVVWKANDIPPVRQVVEIAHWFPSMRGNTGLRVYAQFTGCERTARGAPILRRNRADTATSCAWYGVGMWKCAKRAANVTTKAPAAALGWGAQHGWFGRNAAHAAGRTSFSAIEIAPALARRMSVPQCSAGHVRPAASEMGARCSRVLGTAAAAEHSSSTFHRAARHLQCAHCAPPLAWGNKALDARSDAAAHCGNPGTCVPRARSSPRVTAALPGEAEARAPRIWRARALRNDGAHATRTSRASVAKKTTHRVDEWTSAGGKVHMETATPLANFYPPAVGSDELFLLTIINNPSYFERS
jgi:hypothetical protein